MVKETDSGGSYKARMIGDHELKLELPGTAGFKDVLADIFWFTDSAGYARGPKKQAFEILEALERDTTIRPFQSIWQITIEGDSLGAGVGQIITHYLSTVYPDLLIRFIFKGALHSLSKERSEEVEDNFRICGISREAYKDPVPYFSGIKYKRIGIPDMLGKKRKFGWLSFDWNLLKTHVEAYK